MVKIAICDDENENINLIEKMLLKVGKANQISLDIDIFYNGIALEKAMVNKAQFDILYLDIYMDGADGIITVQNIRKVDENVLIICVSDYDKYLIELFRLEVRPFQSPCKLKKLI